MSITRENDISQNGKSSESCKKRSVQKKKEINLHAHVPRFL